MAFLHNHKVLLNCCNLLFLFCGVTLVVSGFYLFTDSKRILLSRLLAATSEQLNDLPQPLFYYIAIGFALAGLVAVLSAIAGFWASCLHTYCCLSLYFLAVIVLLLAESMVCLAITLWPHCLGITLDESKMVKALQGNYGVPGKEQFTIAMDLAQARFGCCGMSSDINYDTSLWKLQRYGQREWVVPLTCCILKNANDKLSYLDPKPVNETQCQTLQKVDFADYRHMSPCLSYLDTWYREQYVVFLSASLIVAIVEFCVLLTIIFNCTKVQELQNVRGKTRQMLVENIYGPVNSNFERHVENAYSEDFKGVYIQPRELHKQRHNTTFKPIAKDYSSQKR
ncbi:PREDICTED: tetraspanin-11 [Rhagoletis zephyria]|uniref:tetraspanin-11 n=1 Tax=Rhagoletis zephyria TaxID=28612 RepID=UPI0008116902|nr:PREDICTED: tetraspanin-11 [Rhagoletis zephyria]XP_036332919.1 tetraspanin-11 [Rhagoletis pomonella]